MPRVPVKYWVALSIAALLLLSAWGWQYGTRPLTSEQLAAMAVSAGKPQDRINAIAELSMDNDVKVLPDCASLPRTARIPRCRAAMTRLQAFNDWESVPQYFLAMTSTSQTLREAGYAGVLKHFGGTLPENLAYGVDDPVDQREKVVRRLQEMIQEAKTKKGP